MTRDIARGVDREGHWFISMGPVDDRDIDAIQSMDNVEPWELRTYRILVDVDRFDPDMGRAWHTVRASGPQDAKNQVREDHPDAAVLRVEEAA